MRQRRLLLLVSSLTLAAHSQQIVSLTGTVSIRAADDAPWSPAAPGMAIAGGSSILLGPKATAEIRVDPSDSLVAAANSQLKFAGFDNDKCQVELTSGKITYQAADPAAASLRVNLPGVSVEPVQPGIYLIAQAPGGQSQLEVQAGLARVAAPSGSELVNAGQKMLIRYSANGPEFRVVSAFSRWRRFLNAAAAVVQIAGNISAGASAASGSDDSSRKSALPPIKTASNAPKPVDTRQRSDPPPARPSPPSSSPPPASKTK